MTRHISAPPPPRNHLCTLSRVGYSFTSAIGDIIDNSIAANAKHIEIIFLATGDEPSIHILDNGSGMSEAELIENMVIGCKDPDIDREIGDLGRFGAGLKTASFSQAKELTVISWKKLSEVGAARWNTELVKEKNAWILEVFDKHEIEELRLISKFTLPSTGTIVSWSKLSCIDFKAGSSSIPHQIAKLCDELSKYLSLYFHRFLSSGLKITLNNRKLKPLDPFMREIKGYEEGPSQTLRSNRGFVRLQAHVLPRLTNLTNEQLEIYGGGKEISRSQGLYVYRDRRLILAGGWYGLATQDELGKLTRIQIDIPATLDSEWSTDVKKSSLTIPRKIRQILKRIIPSPVARSRRVMSYEGKKEVESDYWSVITNNAEGKELIKYQVNSENELLQEIYSEIPNSIKRKLGKYLLGVSASLPVNHIYATKADRPKSIETVEVNDELENFLESFK